MLDNVDHIHDFINLTWRFCSLLGGWISSLIFKPYRKVVSEDMLFWRSFGPFWFLFSFPIFIFYVSCIQDLVNEKVKIVKTIKSFFLFSLFLL